MGPRVDKQLSKVNLVTGIGEIELIDAFANEQFDPRVETDKTIIL